MRVHVILLFNVYLLCEFNLLCKTVIWQIQKLFQLWFYFDYAHRKQRALELRVQKQKISTKKLIKKNYVRIHHTRTHTHLHGTIGLCKSLLLRRQ